MGDSGPAIAKASGVGPASDLGLRWGQGALHKFTADNQFYTFDDAASFLKGSYKAVGMSDDATFAQVLDGVAHLDNYGLCYKHGILVSGPTELVGKKIWLWANKLQPIALSGVTPESQLHQADDAASLKAGKYACNGVADDLTLAVILDPNEYMDNYNLLCKKVLILRGFASVLGQQRWVMAKYVELDDKGGGSGGGYGGGGRR